VVTRGGGSADDLAAFNDEKLVRAIAGSRIPTLVGVGHETDVSLCDLAADVSAITPSNAAQVIVPNRAEIIRTNWYRVGQLPFRLEAKIDDMISDIDRKLILSARKIETEIDSKLENHSVIKELINQINPSTVLKRGYSIIRGSCNIGSTIDIETSDKIILAEVKNVRKK